MVWAFFSVGIVPCGHFSVWAIFLCNHHGVVFFLCTFFCELLFGYRGEGGALAQNCTGAANPLGLMCLAAPWPQHTGGGSQHCVSTLPQPSAQSVCPPPSGQPLHMSHDVVVSLPWMLGQCVLPLLRSRPIPDVRGG